MELSIGIVVQICIYTLSGSAAGLTLLDWYFGGHRADGTA